MIWYGVTLGFWALTAAVAYWFFFTPVSSWLDRFNEKQAKAMAPHLSDRPLEEATPRMKKILFWIEAGSFVLGFSVSQHPLFGFWAAGMTLFAIHYLAKVVRARAAERFDDQLVDVAFAFRNSLKAGLGLPQTMQMIANDFSPPAAEQFRIAVREIQLGASIEDALHHLVERVPNADLRMMVDSIDILRQTGGNMVETFEGVAETLKNRKKVEGKIKTITAQGRYQTMMLCAMPFVMLLILYFMQKSYIEPLFTTFLGWVLLSLVVLLVGTGWVVINKITAIEV